MNPELSTQSAPIPSPTNQVPQSGAETLLKPAGRLKRWIASILDGIFLGLIGLPLIIISQFITQEKISFETTNTNLLLSHPWFIIITFLVVGLYKIGFLYKNEATPGKAWLKIKVVQSNGKRINLLRAIIREVSQMIYYFPLLGTLIYLISVLLFLFSKNRRTVHDLIGGTIVVQA